METNYCTEFVAVLSNQPQGGFITRKPMPPVLVAGNGDDNFFGSFFQRSWDPQPADPRLVDQRPVDPRRRAGGQYYRQAQPQSGWGW